MAKSTAQWRLGKRGQRIAKVIHLAFAAIWLGGLATMLWIGISAGTPLADERGYGADLALYRIITAIRVTRNRTSHYARIAEAVLTRVLERQTPAVDAITGATTTSKCLLKAVEAALVGNPD